MEEKIVLKEKNDGIKCSIKIAAILFIIIILVGILIISYFPISSNMQFYNEHISQGCDVDFCYNDNGTNVCEYKKYNNAFTYALTEFLNDLTRDTGYLIFLIVLEVGGCALFCSVIAVVLIANKHAEYIVTDSKIYGKKGFKKFNIAFNDIYEITQTKKGIVINNQLNLSSIKKSEEIYNYIKPFVPEITTEQQSTSTVDDIKLF